MLFIINIVMLIVFFITRLFCYITTFKALKYSEDFYEANPIMRKILKCKGGKILSIIFGFSCIFVILYCNIMMQIGYPEYIWIITIIIFILSPFFIFDFLNDLIFYFRDYRKVVKNDRN